MSVTEGLASLEGNWKGTNKLYFGPGTDAIESPSTATVSKRIGGQFLEIAYTWQYEGAAHDGMLVIGCDRKSHAAQAIWTDSWHMSHKFMVCDGAYSKNGSIDVRGTYQVPDHPDWSWRTEIIPGENSFLYRMYNISPEGEEDLAVETEFARA